MTRLCLILILLSSHAWGDESQGCRGGAGNTKVIVTSSADSGQGTLREAVNQGFCGEAVISFQNAMTITLESTINITQAVEINGDGLEVIIAGNGHQIFNVVNSNDALNISQLKLIGGAVSDEGAAIKNLGRLTVSQCEFLDNQGALDSVIHNQHIAEITDSVFAHHSVDLGVIVNTSNGQVTAENVTFYNNGRTQSIASAIHNDGLFQGSHLTISQHFGGAAILNMGVLTLQNSLVSGLGTNTLACDNDKGNVTIDHSLIESGNCGGDVFGNPGLLPLAYNGGVTQTVGLSYDSAAIDSANDSTCANDDQRGVDRPQYGHCDVGAFEFDSAPVLYVDASATSNIEGVCDVGACWQEAYQHLNDALAVSGNHDIWVAQGVYYPDLGSGVTNDDPDASFLLNSGHQVFGGFSGNETLLEQRNPDIYLTVLSGDIDQNDVDSDADGVIQSPSDVMGNNSYNIMELESDGGKIDGVTFTAGHSRLPVGSVQTDNRGNGLPQENGGAIYANYQSVTLDNVNFIGNQSERIGGAIFDCDGCEINNSLFINNHAIDVGGAITCFDCVITDSRFENNVSDSQGGGMRGYGELIDNIFSENLSGSNGGALMATGGDVYINRNVFINNSSDSSGGAMRSHANTEIRNSAFVGNQAVGDGGAVWLTGNGNSSELIGSTFSGNGSISGGAITISSHDLDIKNTVIWNNQDQSIAGSSSHSILNDNQGSDLYIIHSDIENSGAQVQWDPLLGTDGGNNRDLDPKFIQAYDWQNQMVAVDLSLPADSPLIDRGGSGLLQGPKDQFDLLGKVREVGDQVDMGAYESNDLIFRDGFD
ncbi:right-handed parallel beta-helix repeat-containing protein [Marinicella rhabdoformis]|uniref:right-handed parallel beta-helix repeat-containing protein n=1 Tax=Marinicella rhabdoformis TaxID=2580566 RepID=UPI0012AED9CB|nr:right-handed parallel beta-helix repeat-containing protein [Marinicella rhabdoformis]